MTLEETQAFLTMLRDNGHNYEDLENLSEVETFICGANADEKELMFLNLMAYHERIRQSILASAAATLRSREDSRRELITNFARYVQGTGVISDDMAFGMLVGQFIAGAK
jgi:hypothetical protein